jgi:hypothetical protein
LESCLVPHEDAVAMVVAARGFVSSKTRLIRIDGV